MEIYVGYRTGDRDLSWLSYEGSKFILAVGGQLNIMKKNSNENNNSSTTNKQQQQRTTKLYIVLVHKIDTRGNNQTNGADT